MRHTPPPPLALRALAAQVVSHLDDYAVSLEASSDWAVTLTGPNEQTLMISQQRGTRPARVAINAIYPTMPKSHTGLPSERITVAADRGAEAIAGEIRRRLLPGYTERLTDQLRRREEQRAAGEVRETVVAALADQLPGARICDGRVSHTSTVRGTLLALDITPNADGTTAEVRATGLPMSVVETLAAAYRKALPDAS